LKPYDAAHFNHESCKPFLLEGGEKGVLLLHGFSGSVAHMRPLGDMLWQRGYTVMGVNLPGHAATEREMALTDWRQWLNASREALGQLRNHCDTVTVTGLSMGGVLSLILAEEKLADACVTLSAPMAVQNKLFHFARFVSLFIPRVSWAAPEERRQLPYAAFDYGYSGFSTQKAADLSRLIGMARRNLNQIDCPLLVVQSDGDETIARESAQTILDGAASVKKQKLTLTEAPHVCTLSAELPAIVSAMDAFLENL
jgi:carboxylesterase